MFEAQATPVPRLVGMADGIVLELGPGSGGQLPRFNISNISRIYGVESNEELCDRLRNGIIEQHGLSDIYVPINAALENSKLLEEEWQIGAESIDSVVCMQVLCSVQDPAAAAKQIHRLLKPGGQLLFWEHRASQDWVTRHIQGENFRNSEIPERLEDITNWRVQDSMTYSGHTWLAAILVGILNRL